MDWNTFKPVDQRDFCGLQRDIRGLAPHRAPRGTHSGDATKMIADFARVWHEPAIPKNQGLQCLL
jgi:hypothetical protein